MNKKGCNNFKIWLMLCLLFCGCPQFLWAQKTVENNYPFPLDIHPVGKDSGFVLSALGLQTRFESQAELFSYVNKITPLLAAKGYPAASVDSSWQLGDTLHIVLYTGKKYNWVQLSTNNIDIQALDAAGFAQKNFSNKPINISQLQLLQERLLNYFEKHGYPFASVFLYRIQIK
jgi:hypothetical protein